MATVTTKSINWGGVLKGVAIVTAVVAVGVVASYAVSALASSSAVSSLFVGMDPTLHSIGVSLLNGLATAGDFLWEQALNFADFAKDLWKELPDILGLSHSLNPSATGHLAGAASIAGKLPAAAGIAAAAATVPAAVHAINNLQLVDTHTVVANTASSAHSVHAAHDAAIHTAAEHSTGSHGTNWSSRFNPKNIFGSHAEATRASQGTNPSVATMAATPRNGDFASMIDAQTDQLNQSLAK